MSRKLHRTDMALKDDISSEVDRALAQTWELRDGTVVPETDAVKLAGGGVRLEAAMLYADLADSTRIAMWDKRVAARLFKAFLASSARIIRARGGYIRSFDGDRVMGVFIGNVKNTSAAKAALNINYLVNEIIRPKFESKYDAFNNGTFSIGHSVGIDVSDLLVTRAGIANNNDLIWVGSAPNVAAKLSSIRVCVRATQVNRAVSGGGRPRQPG